MLKRFTMWLSRIVPPILRPAQTCYAANEVGVPSIRGVTGALTDYGYGAVGGAVFRIGSEVAGNGMIGGAIAAALAGSVVKGPKGEIIATMAGFQAGLGLPEALGVTGGGNGGDEGMAVI